MKMNTDLMLEVRNHIRMNPELHDQQNWVAVTGCGTTHCIAGWACALSGLTHSQVGNRDGWHFAAQDLLGLDDVEAHALFFEMNEERALELLDRYIEQSKNGE